MDESTASGLAAFGLIGTLFLIVLAILWILVPFAIFGIKPLLVALGKEQRRTNEILSVMVKQMDAVMTTPAAAPPPAQPSVPTHVPAPVEDTRTLSEIVADNRRPT